MVIDEAHRYRGVLGSNVAFLLRRLLRMCQHYGSNPRYIISSATLANPQEFAGRLCGVPFTLVEGDGAPRGSRQFVLINPYKKGTGNVPSTGMPQTWSPMHQSPRPDTCIYRVTEDGRTRRSLGKGRDGTGQERNTGSGLHLPCRVPSGRTAGNRGPAKIR